MEFSTISIKTSTGGKIDLLSNFIKIDTKNVIIDDWILVDEQSAMLLDLISYTMYGTDEYVDMLKKFNKINNPLAIQIGQIIAIPNITSLQANSKVITPLAIQKQAKVSTSSTANSNNTPSKKLIPSSNFIKKSNGNIIF